jgi:hypothetical protein
MKQVFYKTIFLLTILCVISGIIGTSNTNACDRMIFLRHCMRQQQKATEIKPAAPETEEYTDFILTSTILRF